MWLTVCSQLGCETLILTVSCDGAIHRPQRGLCLLRFRSVGILKRSIVKDLLQHVSRSCRYRGQCYVHRLHTLAHACTHPSRQCATDVDMLALRVTDNDEHEPVTVNTTGIVTLMPAHRDEADRGA